MTEDHQSTQRGSVGVTNQSSPRIASLGAAINMSVLPDISVSHILPEGPPPLDFVRAGRIEGTRLREGLPIPNVAEGTIDKEEFVLVTK